MFAACTFWIMTITATVTAAAAAISVVRMPVSRLCSVVRSAGCGGAEGGGWSRRLSGAAACWSCGAVLLAGSWRYFPLGAGPASWGGRTVGCSGRDNKPVARC